MSMGFPLLRRGLLLHGGCKGVKRVVVILLIILLFFFFWRKGEKKKRNERRLLKCEAEKIYFFVFCFIFSETYHRRVTMLLKAAFALS